MVFQDSLAATFTIRFWRIHVAGHRYLKLEMRSCEWKVWCSYWAFLLLLGIQMAASEASHLIDLFCFEPVANLTFQVTVIFSCRQLFLFLPICLFYFMASLSSE